MSEAETTVGTVTFVGFAMIGLLGLHRRRQRS
jgi:MYXO-CTERM domain-containing protein